MDLNMDLNTRFGDAGFGIGGSIGGGGLGLSDPSGQGSAFSMDLDSSLFGGGGLAGSLYGGADSHGKSKPRTTSRFFSSADDPELVPGATQGTATGAAVAPGSGGASDKLSSMDGGRVGTSEAEPGAGTAAEGESESAAGASSASARDDVVAALRRETSELRDALGAATRATKAAEARAVAAVAEAAAAKEEAEALRKRCEELEKRAASNPPQSSFDKEVAPGSARSGAQDAQAEGKSLSQLEAELADTRGKLEAETGRADKAATELAALRAEHAQRDPEVGGRAVDGGAPGAASANANKQRGLFGGLF